MTRRLALGLAAAVLGASSAVAQSFGQAVQEAQTSGPGQLQEPDFFISELWALGRRWSVNAIYGDWSGEGDERARHWIIRRSIGGQTGQTALMWADSRTCPAMEGILIAMEEMEPPSPQVFGLRSGPERVVMVADGAQVVFRARWARAGSEDAAVQMELEGNVNAPHAIWWEESVEVLSDCWAAEIAR